MDKPFRLWHKGAILNLQGCKYLENHTVDKKSFVRKFECPKYTSCSYNKIQQILFFVYKDKYSCLIHVCSYYIYIIFVFTH